MITMKEYYERMGNAIGHDKAKVYAYQIYHRYQVDETFQYWEMPNWCEKRGIDKNSVWDWYTNFNRGMTSEEREKLYITWKEWEKEWDEKYEVATDIRHIKCLLKKYNLHLVEDI